MKLLEPDNYGRTIIFDEDGPMDNYVVQDSKGNGFTVDVIRGTPKESVYDTINAMMPGEA